MTERLPRSLLGALSLTMTGQTLTRWISSCWRTLPDPLVHAMTGASGAALLRRLIETIPACRRAVPKIVLRTEHRLLFDVTAQTESAVFHRLRQKVRLRHGRVHLVTRQTDQHIVRTCTRL